jgi:hypothetical protein
MSVAAAAAAAAVEERARPSLQSQAVGACQEWQYAAVSWRYATAKKRAAL